MKVKLLAILFIVTLFTFVGCDKDSITEAVLGENSITFSGDISKSYDANALVGLATEDTISTFGILLAPKVSESYSKLLSFVKGANELPAIGTYNVGTIKSEDEFNEKFIASYTINNGNSFTTYLMTSGTVKITKSSSSKVAGTFDVSGFYVGGNGIADSTRVLKAKGKFSSIPVDLD